MSPEVRQVFPVTLSLFNHEVFVEDGPARTIKTYCELTTIEYRFVLAFSFSKYTKENVT